MEQLTSAGWAAGLTAHLLEPAGVLAGWQGDDAVVAAAEVGAALAVAADLHEALDAGRARLVEHHELWLTVEARVEQLRDDQRARFADAGARLAALTGTAVENGRPAAVPGGRRPGRGGRRGGRRPRRRAPRPARGARGGRRRCGRGPGRRDPAASSAPAVGRTRRRSPSGWPSSCPGGGREPLASLGRQAADELTPAGSASTLAAAVARWRPLAALPGFAEALVGRLGPGGVTWLLSVLAGAAGTPEAAPLAGLLADALGGPGSLPGGRVGEVLAAIRLDPADPDDALDAVAAAMGMVLAAGAGPTLAAVWGRQLLAREAARGVPTGAGGTGAPCSPTRWGPPSPRWPERGTGRRPRCCWTTPGRGGCCSSRPWPDGTGALATVIDLASAAPRGGRVAGALLLALGEGLAPGSDARVLDDQGALAGVRAAVTGLVAGHPEVVLPVLDGAATGADLSAEADTAVRGLGYLVADPDSAAGVTGAVRTALRDGLAGAFAGEVAGAHVAVLEYGRRVRYALDWAQAQSRAVDADIVWTMGVHAPVALIPGALGDVAGAVETVLSDVLDMNGDVEIGPDTGAVEHR